VSIDPHHDCARVRESADQLIHDVELLDDASLAAPSLLPGWSRANVVGHLVGNAAGLTNLLRWARTGVFVPMYADTEARESTVQLGVGQPAWALATQLREAVDAFLAAADELTDEQWAAPVRLGIGGQGREVPAAEVPWRRLVEQEVHNVDLAGAYTPAHWSPEFVHRLLDEVAERYLGRDDVPALDVQALDGDWSARSGDPEQAVRVEGPSPALLAWLTGRSSGEGLHVHPAPLPDLPAWY
jgi:maleylpyruvate isomerase